MTTEALFILEREHWENIYGPEERTRLEKWIPTPFRFYTKQSICEAVEELSQVKVIFSSWGMPRCDKAFLERVPHLKAIFYAAGSVRCFVTDALWDRGIIVSSSNSSLAVTVAEFTLAQILLSLKLTWRYMADIRAMRHSARHTIPGIYDSVIGLISVGAVARHLISLLHHFKLRIVVYDPFLSEKQAQELRVERVSLEELFEISHVVSLHAPWLPETEGMIRGHHFSRMRKDGTFINTARGIVVNEAEMIEALKRRPDIQVLLDVTHPEPPAPDSPLYTLPNIILTPHIAGARDSECRRLGAMAVDEFERHLKGEPLHGEVRQEMMATSA